MLAEQLLEGYSGFNATVNESNIIDPTSYLNEVCIEAITALNEAVQQYYIGDIIGQSEVILEGYTGDALMESIGSKAKQLWEAFKKKVKEIIAWFAKKVKNVVNVITDKIKKMNNTADKTIQKLRERDKIIVNRNTLEVCINGPKVVRQIGDYAFDTIKSAESYAEKLSNIESFILDHISMMTRDQELIKKIDTPKYSINGQSMTVDEISDMLAKYEEKLETGDEYDQVKRNTMVNYVKVTKEIGKIMMSGNDTLANVSKKVEQSAPKVINDSLVKQVEDTVDKHMVVNANDPTGEKRDAAVIMLCQDITTIVNNITTCCTACINMQNASIRFTNRLLQCMVINSHEGKK